MARSLTEMFNANFMRIVALVESNPALVRFFEALFRLSPALKRLVLGQIETRRSSSAMGIQVDDGSLFVLPCDSIAMAAWDKSLSQGMPQPMTPAGEA